MTHPRMRAIPDRLLIRGAAAQEKRRQIDLIAWCEGNGFRPTWQDLEDERNRRATR